MFDIEDAEEVTVGRYYMVPVVCVNPHYSALRRVPVMQPSHEDSEIIGFPDRHYHPDRRFVSQAWLDYYGAGLLGKEGHWSAVYCYTITRDGQQRDTGMFDLGRQKMKCKRLVDPFRKDAPWLRKLEKAYAGETLRDGLVCPHRGISCRGVKVDDQGCVVCPGHGLRWNTQSGRLVSRIGQTLKREP